MTRRSYMKKALMLALVSILSTLFFVSPANAAAYAEVTGHQEGSAPGVVPGTNQEEFWGEDCEKIVDGGELSTYELTQDYALVIVKAASSNVGVNENTLFANASSGELVWADTNGSNSYDPGGQTGDKAISHIIACDGTEEPPVDVCPNLEGDQATVPDGYVKDEQGNCVTEDDPEPIKVRAGVHFSDPTCNDPNGSEVGVTQVDGVSYQIVGDIEPGGTVTVFATADKGYVLVGPNEWDHQFAYLEGCGEEPPVDVCEEDEPCWDCETDGNGDCDEPNEPNKPNKPEQPNEPKQPKQPTLPATGGNLTMLAIAVAMLLGGGLLVRASRA
jgi:hypothetical protein